MAHQVDGVLAPSLKHDLRYLRRTLWVVGLATIFHLCYSTHLELVGDEAYYWLWSRHLDICYLDKGPMIAWLIAASTAVFGQTVFGVRFFAPLLAAGTGLFLFFLTRRMFSARVAFWAVVLSAVLPLYFVGASLMTIDTIYVFFWSWAAYLFWRAQETSRPGLWIATGAVVGLGILSKYTALVEILSFALYCFWHPPARSHFRRVTFWSMVVTALLFLVPAVVWNQEHGWPTTAWLWQRGGLDEGFSIHPLYLLRFLGEQAGVISPLLFLGLLFLVCRPSLYRSAGSSVRYSLALFLPLFLLYLLSSLHYPGKPNWTAAAYLGGVILLAAEWPKLFARYRWTRTFAWCGLLLGVAQCLILLDTRWLHLPPRADPLDRARGLRDLAAQVVNWEERTGVRLIICDNYMTAALLSFYLPGQPTTYLPPVERPRNQLEIWPGFSREKRSEVALLICKKNEPPKSLDQSFPAVVHLARLTVRDGERRIATYHLFLLANRPGMAPPGSTIQPRTLRSNIPRLSTRSDGCTQKSLTMPWSQRAATCLIQSRSRD